MKTNEYDHHIQTSNFKNTNEKIMSTVSRDGIENCNNNERFYSPYGSSCPILQYYILCGAETLNGENCSSLSYNTPDYVYKTTPLLSNDTSTFFQIVVYNMPLGNNKLIINSQLTLTIECIELDLNKVSFNLINNILNPKSEFYGIGLLISYEMVGDYDKSIDTSGLRGIANSIGLLPIVDSNNFDLVTEDLISTNLALSPLVVSLMSNLKSRDINLTPLSIFDSIYDVKVYPDIEYLLNLDTFGLGQSAIIEFKMNNTANSFYLVNLNGTTIKTPFHPISGNESSTTYLYSLSNFDLPTLYELYCLNDNKFVKSTSIEAKVNKYKNQRLPSLGKIYMSYPNDLSTITYGFSDTILYEFPPITVWVGESTRVTRFPFGYTNGSPSGYEFKINSLVRSGRNGATTENLQLISNADSSGVLVIFNYKDTTSISIEEYPMVTDYEFIPLVDNTCILRLSIKAPYTLNYIKVKNQYYYGSESKISGDLNEGVYEFIVNTMESVSVSVYDNYMCSLTYNDFSPVSISPNLKYYNNPSKVPSFNFSTIDNVSFLYNDIDVTNHRQYNVLYFSCSTLRKEDASKISISLINIEAMSNINANDLKQVPSFQATYNDQLQLFQIEFYVECNTPIGNFVFTMVSNYNTYKSSSLKSQLRIKKSNLDLRGPIFQDVKKLSPSITIDETNRVGEIGWRLLISDSINGFKSGYVVIKGELDQSIYNISIALNDGNIQVSGNEFLGEYDVKIKLYYPCISQTYLISQVGLYDKIGRLSYFSTLDVTDPSYAGVLNPFINFLNDTMINKIQLQCSSDPIASVDTTPPVLTSVTPSTPSINVGQSDREITIRFEAQDPESGLKNNTLPIVYFSTTNNIMHECISQIISIDSQKATYSCTTQLPFGFGFPDGIIFSIYGLINNNGLFTGYSTNDLMDLQVIYSIAPLFDLKPTILSHYRISEKGGDLWIYGRGLNGGQPKAIITFNDGTSTEITSSTAYSSAILFKNIKSTDKPYQLRVFYQDSGYSTNTLIITPTVYDFYIPLNPEIASSSNSDSSNSTLPTNKPQSCPGNPVCGGPSNGKCVENKGCLCYSPWFGKDCLSQIIIIDPPTINNETGPSIDIIVPDNNNNNNSTTVTYHSLISIVGLREIDINGKAIEYHQFDNNWVSEQIEQFTFNFYNQLNVKNQIINAKVTLKWFTNQTTIEFAGQELTMNPSSLKYTINISSYPFRNRLSQLQLVMSALFESNTTQKICSSKEFDETSTGDNSNYIKIQIDNHSLYGRFIKRAIIDSKVKSVSNVLLDSNLDSITSSKKIQSFIGIEIPYYENSTILDPDFSILVDSYAANSICSNKSLSGGKIAGIVIGSFAFVAVIIISIIYVINKKNRDKKLITDINNKIKSMNNDQL